VNTIVFILLVNERLFVRASAYKGEGRKCRLRGWMSRGKYVCVIEYFTDFAPNFFTAPFGEDLLSTCLPLEDL